MQEVDRKTGPGLRFGLAVLRSTAALTAIAMTAFAANSLLCRLALAGTHIDPGTFTLVRIGAGGLTLFGLCRIGRGRPIAGSWLSATALLAYAGCFTFAYVSLTAATGALLLFGAVQATMIGRGLLGGERLAPPQWGGLALAVAGLLTILLPSATQPDAAGAVLMIAAGVAWGGYSLLGRGTVDPLAATAGNFMRAAPMAVPLLAFSTSRWDSVGLLCAVASGAVASGVGYAIWYSALRGLTPARAATVQLSVPVITALSGVLLLGEPLTLRLVLASTAVLAGIALVIVVGSGWQIGKSRG